jgi:hypothetical protein
VLERDDAAYRHLAGVTAQLQALDLHGVGV